MKKIIYYTLEYSRYGRHHVQYKKYFSTLDNLVKYIQEKYGKIHDINGNEIDVEVKVGEWISFPYGYFLVTKTEITLDEFTINN